MLDSASVYNVSKQDLLMQKLRFDLDEPSMYRHGLRNTDYRKVEHESYNRYDEHVDCSPLKLYQLS